LSQSLGNTVSIITHWKQVELYRRQPAGQLTVVNSRSNETKSFYGWQEQFFKAALAGFDKKRAPEQSKASEAHEVEAGPFKEPRF
jgi:hypothetical protein